ncbi:DUF3265 domain-containing protein [Vibrio parahaemolyticus]|nr:MULTISPECIES: DUF3265 domain-containing protein [Vibrio harveyi group]MCX8794106.1 DUF3265 domain-containing protein [Vibrio parahaemolyticus]MCX8950729.1 DUF3265 domain-containing protein [Vibrio parahaemolyticus]MDF2283305.1 DUF3265 domain-containing protein [Vibrio parahaemolyticus]MDF2301847.1 DUF3265 domain-containing protein [Vibrio parahaemolyticus]MDF2311113.1 DUF3265 domain-containing protein [Vibrio parahaemolyticus]
MIKAVCGSIGVACFTP